MPTIIKRLSLCLLAILLFAGCGIYFFIFRSNTQVKDDGILIIDKNDTFETVTKHLQEKGYLRNLYSFQKVAQLKSYPKLIKSGRYKLRPGMNNNELINLLRSGKQEPILFTFNNIRTLNQFAGVVSKQLEIDSAELVSVFSDKQYISQLGFTPENLIGMFIPNTYQIYWDIPARKFLDRMHHEYHKFWNPTREQAAKKAGLSPMDITIIASIVEEETVLPTEYPIIAGVYVNRLKRGIALAACPTLKFALNDFSLKRILKKHTEVESPYNTYKHRGLPPGPVRMPSIRVIDAVLNYQQHDYLYFCAKSDFSGGHYFSRTLRQHNEYANEYHKALNKKKIY